MDIAVLHDVLQQVELLLVCKAEPSITVECEAVRLWHFHVEIHNPEPVVTLWAEYAAR